MSVTANLTTNVETITATIVVEDEAIIAQVNTAARGPAGEAGAAGAAGPNTLTTATTTNLTGFISGNGTNVSGATAAATTATANTLVLRSAAGGASFAGLNTNSGSYAQIGGENFNVATTSNANLTTTGSGTVIVSGAGGTTISGGPLTISASSATFATGSISTSQPLTLTQTWTNAATTYTGLQVNVTDTASAAASLLIDLRADGLSKFRVKTQPSTGPNSGGFLWEADTSGGVFSINGAGNLVTLGAIANHDISLSNDQVYVFRSAVGGGLRIGSAALSPRLHSDSDHTLAQRNGTAAQESRIYGTYTGPGNYRRLALKMDTAGVAQIVAEGGGAGAAGNVLQLPSNTTFADLTATRAALGIQTKTGTSTGLDAVGTTDITGLTGYDLEADTWYKLELQYLWTSASSNFQINFVTTGTLLRGGTTPVLGQSMSSAAALSTTFFVNNTTFALRGSVGETRTNLPAFGYAYFKTGTAGTGKVQLQLLAGTTLSTIVSSCAVLTKQQ
jgi:hypothetical protein